MHCRKCGEKAVINMHQHRLSLCRAHFLEWLPQQTEHAIEKYGMFTRGERLLLAVSGGKDSLALWDVLQRLGFQADGLYINLGIDENLAYSDQSELIARRFAQARQLKLIIVDVKDQYGESIPAISLRARHSTNRTCSVCGLIKRHIFNQIALEQTYDVLLTAHNLDDEASVLLANTLDWSLARLARGLPMLPAAPGFARKGKPFCRFYERETAAYSFLRGIEYMQEECPFASGSKQLLYKEHLNQLEERMPGTKLRFFLNYLSAVEKVAFPDQQEADPVLAEKRCPHCGQPTTTGDTCAFCKLFEKKIPPRYCRGDSS